MAKTIVVCGHGPGISDAVARKFAGQGFSVALVARNAERVGRAASAIGAEPFPCDLGDPDAVRAMLRHVRSSLGPITVVHWNAYAAAAGDIMTAPVDDLRKVLDVAVHGFVAAVQEALPDLKEQKGAVLVTGGGIGASEPKVDAMAVQWGAMGVAVAKAAQHKLVGLLHRRLLGEGVYVGEVIVVGAVKGTAFDSGNATLEASAIAEKFWDLYIRRTDVAVRFPA